MTKIKILAVEDNAIHQATIFMCLEKLGYELVAIVDNSVDAVAQALITKPDLILMDIQIQGNKDGIETAAQINKLCPCPIIFTTSMSDSETIQRAKTTLPYAYLIKPMTVEKLQSAIEIAVYRFAQEKNTVMENSPTMSEGDETVIQDSFFIKENNSLVKVSIHNILWVEADKDKYCKIITAQKAFFVRSPLKEIIQKLPENLFIQIHRSIIVQVDKITSINDFDGTVFIEKSELPLGKTYKADLMGRLKMF